MKIGLLQPFKSFEMIGYKIDIHVFFWFCHFNPLNFHNWFVCSDANCNRKERCLVGNSYYHLNAKCLNSYRTRCSGGGKTKRILMCGFFFLLFKVNDAYFIRENTICDLQNGKFGITWHITFPFVQPLARSHFSHRSKFFTFYKCFKCGFIRLRISHVTSNRTKFN